METMAEADVMGNSNSQTPSCSTSSSHAFSGTKTAEKEEETVQPQPHRIPPRYRHLLYNWAKFLEDRTNAQWVCGVECFKHAPFGTIKWEECAKVGLVVEVPNPKSKWPCRWPAKIIGFAGYNALVEFLRINESEDNVPLRVWISFCSNIPKPIMYSAANRVLYYPVYAKDQEDPEFFEKMIEKVVTPNLPTVMPNHWEHCLAEIHATGSRFKVGEVVEALDKRNCSRNRTGLISLTLANRIHVQYLGLPANDQGFWFTQQSENVHKIGWSQAVGCAVVGASQDLDYPLPPPSEFPVVPAGVKVIQGVFEMRHPIQLHKMCVGYVVRPLQYGYFLAGTDWTRPSESVQVVIHVTSDYIFPLNFCRQHGIELAPPCKTGEGGEELTWKKLLTQLKYKPLDLSPIKKNPAKFGKGWKMEAVYLKKPTYLGPATVTRVCGHLIQVHFDGYPRTKLDSFQWVSAKSSDIYPVGFCQAVGHKLDARPELPNLADMYAFVNSNMEASK